MTGFKCEFCTDKRDRERKKVEKKGDSAEKEITKQRGWSQKKRDKKKKKNCKTKEINDQGEGGQKKEMKG